MPKLGKVLDIEGIISPDNLAAVISNRWNEWNSGRQKWLAEKSELRNYLFATDTRTTGNKKLPWFNSTTLPKLTQIRDNLHANYFFNLFPNSHWLKWEGDNIEADGQSKRETIEAYMHNKLNKIKFTSTVSALLNDYIDWGMAVARVGYQAQYTDLASGAAIPKYIGPTIERISPFDIVFNPTADTYEDTPKIIRELKTLGDLAKEVRENPNDTALETIYLKISKNREHVNSYADNNQEKNKAYVADGFSSLSTYYKSGFVEQFTFYGDLYDETTGTLYSNYVIRVIDRAYIVSMEPNPSWLGRDPIYIVGWRGRPDNLYPMGPLDNLVGLQYRLDHLENLRADIFDQIALPVLKIRGDVEDFEFAPGARIFVGEEGDVDYLRPDGTALQADFQINSIENKMEEFAGAPRQAMGIRTPGEKTAFEVQSLENASSRIFQHKTAHFEREFLEPIINAMLEASRRNINVADTVRIVDPDTGAARFMEISHEDLTSNGRIYPVGARHFAERAQRVQNLVNLVQLKADPSIGAHLSGKEIARLLAYELREPAIFGDNISITEMQDTSRLADEAAVGLEVEAQVAAEQGL